jgi:hypothetical protein
MLASRAALLRQLAVAADDTVANRTLGLAFESAGDVAAERGDAIGDGAVLLICVLVSYTLGNSKGTMGKLTENVITP